MCGVQWRGDARCALEVNQTTRQGSSVPRVTRDEGTERASLNLNFRLVRASHAAMRSSSVELMDAVRVLRGDGTTGTESIVRVD